MPYQEQKLRLRVNTDKETKYSFQVTQYRTGEGNFTERPSVSSSREVNSQDSHSGATRSLAGKYAWDLWETKWNWNKFLLQVMRFSSASRHQCCSIIAVPEMGDSPNHTSVASHSLSGQTFSQIDLASVSAGRLHPVLGYWSLCAFNSTLPTNSLVTAPLN